MYARLAAFNFSVVRKPISTTVTLRLQTGVSLTPHAIPDASLPQFDL
jgi:hypothetical protein